MADLQSHTASKWISNLRGHHVPAIPEVQPGAGDRFGAGLRAIAATFLRQFEQWRSMIGPPRRGLQNRLSWKPWPTFHSECWSVTPSTRSPNVKYSDSKSTSQPALNARLSCNENSFGRPLDDLLVWRIREKRLWLNGRRRRNGETGGVGGVFAGDAPSYHRAGAD